MKVLAILCVLLLGATPSNAGVFEFSIQGSSRVTNIDTDNYSEALTTSASLAYYFWQSGALELTYMEGSNQTNGRVDLSTLYEQLLTYKYYGVDFIYNIGGSEGSFIPYVKVGLAQIKKELQYKTNGSLVSSPQESEGKNLAYGLGFKLKFTETFGLKVSYDVWQGPLDESNQTKDSSLKVGFTWYL